MPLTLHLRFGTCFDIWRATNATYLLTYILRSCEYWVGWTWQLFQSHVLHYTLCCKNKVQRWWRDRAGLWVIHAKLRTSCNKIQSLDWLQTNIQILLVICASYRIAKLFERPSYIVAVHELRMPYQRTEPNSTVSVLVNDDVLHRIVVSSLTDVTKIN